MTQQPTDKSTQFVDALRSCGLKEQGWDIFAIYTQAYLETGNFTSPLCRNAYNCWGNKGKYSGQSLQIPTYEFMYFPDKTDRAVIDAEAKKLYPKGTVVQVAKMVVKGEIKTRAKVDIIDDFKLYPSFYAAIMDYVAYVNRLHPGAYVNRAEYHGYFTALQHGPEEWMAWSTDKEYDEKLESLYERLKAQNDGDLYRVVAG
jgi:flagellum-specific peptidoglycan hydrolase FlgJ